MSLNIDLNRVYLSVDEMTFGYGTCSYMLGDASQCNVSISTDVCKLSEL